MPASGLPDFTGKIVVLYLAHPPDGLRDGAVLEYATFRDSGGRLFVEGRLPALDEQNDWVSNLKGGFAWDDVVHYIVFDSREDYLARAGAPRISWMQRLFGGPA